jgi:hypothetical protein
MEISGLDWRAYRYRLKQDAGLIHKTVGSVCMEEINMKDDLAGIAPYDHLVEESLRNPGQLS